MASAATYIRPSRVAYADIHIYTFMSMHLPWNYQPNTVPKMPRTTYKFTQEKE